MTGQTHAAVDAELLNDLESILGDGHGSVHGSVRVQADGEISLRKKEVNSGSVRYRVWSTYEVSPNGLSGSDLLRGGEHERPAASQSLDLSSNLLRGSPSKNDTSGQSVVDERLHL